MPKIKLTKSELKKQRDSLKQFQRFLPTLQLKKQQLQMETQLSHERINKNKDRENNLLENIKSWTAMFGNDADIEKLTKYIKIDSIDYRFNNVAGVEIPVFNKALFKIKDYDLFHESPWLDDAINLVCKIIEIRAERLVLEEQLKRLSRELTITNQRVNLFEKVKIPECKENIKVIQINLGDQQTAAVGRSKMAKSKLAEVFQ